MLPKLLSKDSSSHERFGVLLGSLFWAACSTAAAMMRGYAPTKVAVDILVSPPLQAILQSLMTCMSLLFGGSRQ
jgi:hypothetical protein